MHDSDEKVRAAVCKVVGLVEYETALHNLSDETLRAIGSRMSDKRVSRATTAGSVNVLAEVLSVNRSARGCYGTGKAVETGLC